MSQDVKALESQYVVQTYNRTPIVLVRGKGVRVYDEDGREYLDLLAGIGVGALGHGHEGLAKAIAEQSREMIHCSNLFFHPLQGQVAERLSKLSGMSRAFFCNSGAEAVEACLKFARRYWFTKGDTGRTEIIAMEGDFHGRTYGALSVTWNHREPFAPLLPNITFVPVNDPAKLRAAVSEKTAAIILEPIQGEGGVHPLTQEFANAVNEVTADTGALLIADEVQCGLGRTGTLWAYEDSGVVPDLMTSAKALGAGLPIGALICSPRYADVFAPGDHGSTFAGGPVACSAALAVLDVVSDPELLARVRALGARLAEGVAALPGVVEVRGRGLMLACDFAGGGAPELVRRALLEQRLVANATGPATLRLLPPLTIGPDEVDEALRRLRALL